MLKHRSVVSTLGLIMELYPKGCKEIKKVKLYWSSFLPLTSSDSRGQYVSFIRKTIPSVRTPNDMLPSFSYIVSPLFFSLTKAGPPKLVLRPPSSFSTSSPFHLSLPPLWFPSLPRTGNG